MKNKIVHTANPRARAIHKTSLSLVPISLNFFAPYNCATIGVTAKITPAIKNHIVLKIAEPTPRPAKSAELALPATIVSVVPISI